jgi:hypothetical protein
MTVQFLSGIGAADYTVDIMKASGSLRGAFAGSVTVVHGIPFLLGGTSNRAALRAIAEIEQWIKHTSGTDTISASRAIFRDSISSGTDTTDEHTLIRLPLTQTGTKRGTFVSTGFCNLKMVVDLISDDFERYLLASLVNEMNNLFPLNLATDFVCDRFLEEDTFEETTNCTALVLVGASHLRNLARFLDTPEWQVYDLTTPGWRISDISVQQKTTEIIKLSEQIELEKSTIILQLFDNCVFMAGGTGGTKSLPVRGSDGKYHVIGELVVADKAGIKDLVSKLVPMLKALSGARKLLLSPLSRYWLDPCCDDPTHVTNYRAVGYLPRLGAATSALKDYIRDSLYTRRISNYRVVCSNKILGIGQRQSERAIEDARLLADLWGGDPVHPANTAYKVIAEGILKDISCAESRYTNPPKSKVQKAASARPDLSLARDPWVSGCTAALPRRDAPAFGRGNLSRGKSLWGRSWLHCQQKRGSHPYRGYRGAKGGRGFGHHSN